ncbi:MAG TPA: replication-relaxation family protein [Solirubrobacteraceae bacterium]|nr:replication-relaxation family protein [Solirubrobacteraceae bacterium]
MLLLGISVTTAGIRLRARRRRAYVRLVIEPYRSDRLVPAALISTLAGLHSLVCVRGLRRILTGQASLALEIHHQARPAGGSLAWLAVCVPARLEVHAAAVLRSTYPNCRLRRVTEWAIPDGPVVRLHKRRVFTQPVRRIADVDPDRPPVERLLRAMAAAGGSSVVQIAATPAPLGLARLVPTGGSRRVAEGEDEPVESDRSGVVGPFFWADLRMIGQRPGQPAAIAAELRVGLAPNRLVGRRAPGRRRVWARRIARGEANPMPTVLRTTYAAEELAGLWQLPSPTFAAVPIVRCSTPLAPAPAGIMRARAGAGLLVDAHGPVTIHPQLRRQNTAVVGTVEQGKTSYLVASVRDDLRRPDCAVIVLDPKGDAADAALSVVPDGRVCTLLDMARPTCGFNPLAVDAPVDAIADHVVAAVRALFDDGEVRGSSDRYLRNALIAALAFDRAASLWDVSRLLEVGADGTAARARVADRLAGLPEFAEVASFLAEELPVQLRDARSATTAKLDAPANKLARVLNSTSVKRVLLNESLRIDFDRLIDHREVLVVRGALGEIGTGNVSVLMQLLLGMLDAALGRAQDRRSRGRPTAVALKVDEAPLVINESFAQTMALKRSAGLETVACWQTDAQWPVELRDKLDALFAHRVLFATASAIDARAGAGLLMAEFADQLRVGDQTVATLAAPDVRLHLPRHTAVVSWTTPAGRDRPFIGRTLPLKVDPARIEGLAQLQRARGGTEVDDLSPRRRLGPPIDPELVLPPAGSPAPPPTTTQSPSTAPQLPPTAPQPAPTAAPVPPTADARMAGEQAASFAELVAVDAATGVRWLPVPAGPRRPPSDPRELGLLTWIAGARCALSSQAHRRTTPGQALTGTQRRLKRLADAGLLARFQLHGGDGGGVPFACAVTPAGLELLGLDARRAAVLDEAHLASLRADLHTVGWLLALEARAGSTAVSVLGPGRARIAPPQGSVPDELGLEPGLRARDFVSRAGADGPARRLESFSPISPAAAVELRVEQAGRRRTTDLLVFHEPPDSARTVGLLERCDHLLAGWWRLVPRYARLGGPPAVVILGRDPASTARLAGVADRVLVACLATIGEPPARWAYPSRPAVVFAVESDLHAGVLDGWRVPPLPPAVRDAAGGSTGELRWGPVVDLADPDRGDDGDGGGQPGPPPWR